eukprot:1434158-Alexandrium_andersonii.AAC.1
MACGGGGGGGGGFGLDVGVAVPVVVAVDIGLCAGLVIAAASFDKQAWLLQWHNGTSPNRA